MKHTRELKKLLEDYEQYKTRVLEPSYAQLKTIFKAWESPEYWNKYTTGKGVATPSPVRMVISRIKHPDKIVDKILRKPQLFPRGLCIESVHNMHDAVGIRVLVYFSSQLPLIDRELRSLKSIEVSKNHPPEAYLDSDFLERLGLQHIENKNKESGYSSIHYTVCLKQTLLPNQEPTYFEIQVRTLAQELWSELEHVLLYKPENRTHFSAKRRFQILSKEIGVIDEQFNLLYEELIHNQEITTYKDEDDLSLENLPKVLMEVGIQCALVDLNPILNILSTREIMTIQDFLSIATPRRLETIRNTYISTVGHAPNNLELIFSLATLKGAQTSEIEIERIKSQIGYHI